MAQNESKLFNVHVKSDNANAKQSFHHLWRQCERRFKHSKDRPIYNAKINQMKDEILETIIKTKIVWQKRALNVLHDKN